MREESNNGSRVTMVAEIVDNLADMTAWNAQQRMTILQLREDNRRLMAERDAWKRQVQAARAVAAALDRGDKDKDHPTGAATPMKTCYDAPTTGKCSECGGTGERKNPNNPKPDNPGTQCLRCHGTGISLLGTLCPGDDEATTSTS